jgi:hypothetical protein
MGWATLSEYICSLAQFNKPRYDRAREERRLGGIAGRGVIFSQAKQEGRQDHIKEVTKW